MALLCAAAAGCAATAPRQQPQPPPARYGLVSRAAPATQPTARNAMLVVSCHDGDTITGWIAFSSPVLNVTGTVYRHVRIAGINAPELRAKGGPEARAELVALLNGGDVSIEVVKASDDFGRLVAFVWASGVNVGDEMIRRGKAVPFMVPKAAAYPTPAEEDLARRTGNAEAMKRDRPPK